VFVVVVVVVVVVVIVIIIIIIIIIIIRIQDCMLKAKLATQGAYVTCEPWIKKI